MNSTGSVEDNRFPRITAISMFCDEADEYGVSLHLKIEESELSVAVGGWWKARFREVAILDLV